MTLSQGISDQLCQKLRLVGIPQGVVIPLVNSITRSVAAEGPENVVKRLKVLKQAAVNHLGGLETSFPWIRHDRNGPKGPWRPVWSLLMSTQYKHRKRALNAMMVYASIVLPKRASPTPTQERKFLGSVSHSPQEIAERASGFDRLSMTKPYKAALGLLAKQLARTPYPKSSPDFREWIAVKRGSDLKRLEADEDQLSKFLGQDFGRAFQGFPEVQAVLGQSLIDDYRHLVHPWHGFDDEWQLAVPPTEPIGVIGSTQEPGMKFRAFASPSMVLQCALNPLKDYLLKTLTTCSWDCTHDQDAGVAEVQRWLSEGLTVHSVDLSDATNNFPLDLQLDLLGSVPVIPDSTIHLLRNVSRSPFRVLWSGEQVSWDVGQPLGAGPSFPAFALGHSLIALVAEIQSGIEVEDLGRTFLILGDDIVISNDLVHSHYRSILNTLRCPVSEAKCLSSNVAAEFAGKLVTSQHVFHGFKYKDMSDKSFMAIIRTLGHQAISRRLLSEKQFKFAHMVKEYPEPFGLGFNPKGIPLSTRWEKYLHYQEITSGLKPEPRLSSSAELMNRTMHTWSSRTEKSEYLWYFSAYREEYERFSTPLSDNADRKVKAFLSDYHGRRSASEVLPLVRNEPLRVSSVPDGDPRPDPLQDRIGKTARILADVERRMGVIPSDSSDMEDPSPLVTEGERALTSRLRERPL